MLTPVWGVVKKVAGWVARLFGRGPHPGGSATISQTVSLGNGNSVGSINLISGVPQAPAQPSGPEHRRWASAEEVAAQIGVSVSTVRRRAEDGYIPWRWRVPGRKEYDLAAAVEDHQKRR
jgi:hypothetical protein